MKLNELDTQTAAFFEQGLSNLRVRFIENLQPTLGRIIELQEKLLTGRNYPEALCEVAQICHKIAGTAATLGFPNLGETATCIEGFILAASPNADNTDQNLLSEIENFIDQINAILEEGICLS